MAYTLEKNEKPETGLRLGNRHPTRVINNPKARNETDTGNGIGGSGMKAHRAEAAIERDAHIEGLAFP